MPTCAFQKLPDRAQFFVVDRSEAGAERVEFVSSLDTYNLHRASRLKGSRWAVTVVPNSEFRYFYIVDGAVYLPECELYEKDDFGSRNCVYVPAD